MEGDVVAVCKKRVIQLDDCEESEGQRSIHVK